MIATNPHSAMNASDDEPERSEPQVGTRRAEKPAAVALPRGVPLDQVVPRGDQCSDGRQRHHVPARPGVTSNQGDQRDHGNRVHGDALEPAQAARDVAGLLGEVEAAEHRSTGDDQCQHRPRRRDGGAPAGGERPVWRQQSGDDQQHGSAGRHERAQGGDHLHRLDHPHSMRARGCKAAAPAVRHDPSETGTRSGSGVSCTPMQEFTSVSVSSYEADSLTALLNEKSGDGWDVVAIVPTGSTVTGYLSRQATGDTTPLDDTDDIGAGVGTCDRGGRARRHDGGRRARGRVRRHSGIPRHRRHRRRRRQADTDTTTD